MSSRTARLRRWRLAGVGAVIAAISAFVVISAGTGSSAASGSSYQIPLDPNTPTPITAQNFSRTGSCAGIVSPNDDGWHFVVTGGFTAIISLNLSFNSAFDIVYTWDRQQAYVATPPGAQLTQASATVITLDGQPQIQFLELANTCPALTATPTPTGTATPTPTGTSSPDPFTLPTGTTFPFPFTLPGGLFTPPIASPFATTLFGLPGAVLCTPPVTSTATPTSTATATATATATHTATATATPTASPTATATCIPSSGQDITSASANAAASSTTSTSVSPTPSPSSTQPAPTPTPVHSNLPVTG